MSPIRPMLTTQLLLLVFSTLTSHGFAEGTPEPKRWTGHSTKIQSPATTPTSTESAFPDFIPHASLDAADPADNANKDAIAGPAVTVSASLAVVLGLFAGLVWLTRRYGSRSLNSGVLPQEVLQSLGSTPVDPRTRVTMLRCGNRILVLAQTASGVQPLSEITDPEEVQRLTAACLGDAKHSFASTLKSIENEPVQPNFAGNNGQHDTPRAESRLFASV